MKAMELPQTVTVNGIKYVRREHHEKRMSRQMFSFMAMTMAIGGGNPFASNEPKRPDIDIAKEYELIQQKKSFLTTSQRDWVEYQFEMNYDKVTE